MKVSREHPFGGLAIRNLSMYIVVIYALGYVLNALFPALTPYLTLNPYLIVRGQVWRLVTWILITSGSGLSLMDILFLMIALWFYYSIGTSLERSWGQERYTSYILSGLIFTVISSFVIMGISYLVYHSYFAASAETAAAYFAQISGNFTTVYITTTIFLAFAATFPDAMVLLFFFIPIKVKWLGVLDGVFLTYEFIVYAVRGNWPHCIVIVASLLNFVIFYVQSRNLYRFRPSEMKRRRDWKKQNDPRFGAKDVKFREANPKAKGSADRVQKMRPTNYVHKCAICGRTEVDHPELEFRYCSKCEGSYEFCQDHLFNHIHAANGKPPMAQAFQNMVNDNPNDGGNE